MDPFLWNIKVESDDDGHLESIDALGLCVCVYSNSRNDVPRVAQRYGTIAAHTRRRASVLVMFCNVFACNVFTVLPV